jgi:hypothetical protein
MANNNVGIRNSWSLIAFANLKGKHMQTGVCKNKTTGEEFASCSFENPATGAVTFVGFSQNLGVLSPAQIAARKDELQVVELETGNFKLCKKGESSWADVDLGL